MLNLNTNTEQIAKKAVHNSKNAVQSIWERFLHSFPIQLLILNFKKNQILLIVWLILFGFVTQTAGRVVGAPYLFLDPEYLNVSGIKAFFIIGVSLGVFIVAYHITVYILDSYKFTFLGSIKSPFAVFCLNNSIIPVLFFLVYAFNIFYFQYNNEFQLKSSIIYDILALFLGMISVILLLFFYFTFTNKDAFRLVAENIESQIKKSKNQRLSIHKKYKQHRKDKLKVYSFFRFPFGIAKVNRDATIDKQLTVHIFDQNHLNAVIVELILILVVIILGLFRDNPVFQIPAAASGILFFSMIVMFTGAFTYWLRGWSVTMLFILFILFNLFSKYSLVDTNYQVYGINYHLHKKADYSLTSINQLSKPSDVVKDKNNMIKILNNWRSKFPKEKPPKMVFVCVSGGGQRAALWTLNTLQYIDHETSGKLMRHSILMTGASGGMIGASYYRELYYRKQIGKLGDLYSSQYLTNISKDILNPVMFSLVVNDLFFRFQKFTDGRYEYTKDRGFAFEQTLNRNTDFVFNKRISDYKHAEELSVIPMLILSPTIINDGRKLFISPHDISFMTTHTNRPEFQFFQKIKGIEFRKMFASQDAENLHFLSALRMVATFPYVTPTVQLPSSPTMEIMDAGLSDNFGISDAVKFMYEFQDWIEQNTDGVVFVTIRDSEKEADIVSNEKSSAWQKIISPIGSLYNNWGDFQDLNNDNLLNYAQSWLNTKLDVVEFEYIPKPRYWTKLHEKNIKPEEIDEIEKKERASLSWHLTTREKESLVRTILESNNQASLYKLKKILSTEQ
jgi:hypothetical protein